MRRFHPLTLALFAALTAVLLGGSPALAGALQHRSYLRVGETGGGAARQITLGLNKSMILELPREVREVMVSNPEKIDAVLQTATRAYLIGKAAGEANIIFIDREGRQVVSLEVTVERDLAGLETLLNTLIRGANIKVQTVSGSVILTGTVQNPIDATRAGEIATQIIGTDPNAPPTTTTSSGTTATAIGFGSSTQTTSAPTAAGKLINMLTVEGREQVLLKVSVVEMERNILKQFGVDLNALINSGNFAFAALSSLPYPINTAGRGFLSPFLPNDVVNALEASGVDPPVGARNMSGGGVQWMSDNSRVQSVLRALEQDGLLHTLAEPNLTAISGETANFLAGGEFPIPVAQQLGTISVEFKKFGIGLAFTPVVMSEGRISLKVSTEVSELSNQGAVILSNITIPALKVRRAETVVELPSGGSLVMAGLLSDQSKQALSGYPGLKNLPVLGTLFRSRDFLKNETELVVLVTPYVVKPVARSDLAQPDDGFGWASDWGSDLMGQMNRVYGRHPERAPVGRFDGDVGFIVE
ncbi:MAG TPA: type II and III secretion system protein family protein [Methyloceanibacter sp.]|nr:type II and III secretion system protein family protein [Methyloceanibacter sp.]